MHGPLIIESDRQDQSQRREGFFGDSVSHGSQQASVWIYCEFRNRVMPTIGRIEKLSVGR